MSFINKKSFVLAIISLWVIASVFLFQNCSTHTDNETASDSVPVKEATYMGDLSCKNCHSQEHNEWEQSHHFMAMQPANDTTVLGDFNDVTLNADGVKSRFFKNNGKFYINTQNENGENEDFEVKYTFGFTPLQQYLVEFPGGRMQVPRVSWDVINKKWFNQYAGTKIPAHDWLHWTQNSQNWNTMCASCHSTNLNKGFDWQKDEYHTTYNAINVSCESCHGPGSEHIRYVSSSDYHSGEKTSNSFISLGKNSGQTAIINNCAICHSRKTDITGAVMSGKEFMDDFIPQIPTTEFFHADGQMDGEVYNYTSFLQSKMFRNGVMCTDCHNPHSGKLVKPGNLVCGKCHESSKFDVPEHTFHPIGSSGSECKNCHMHSQVYMGNDPRHDHSFRVPRPDLTVKYGTPNTCNDCHTDKTAEWAASAIEKNYGSKRKYHFAEDLIPGSRIDETSFMHLKKLLNDTAVPGIIRATSAHYLENIVTTESLDELLKCLNDTNPLVRYQALQSLSNFPPETWNTKAAPFLIDSVKAVRIAAASLFAGLPSSQIPSSAKAFLPAALNELEQYSLYQTDFSVGNLTAGDFYLKVNNYVKAAPYYKRAIKLDSLMNYARLNLSVALNLQGKNEEALEVLNDAAKLDPGNERIYFNKALLLVEMNDKKGAMKAFDQAVNLHSLNTRVYYNYGLLLEQSGDSTKAESVYLKGLKVDPLNGDLNYVLTLHYIGRGMKEKAQGPLSILLTYYKDVPDYEGLLKNFQTLER